MVWTTIIGPRVLAEASMTKSTRRLASRGTIFIGRCRLFVQAQGRRAEKSNDAVEDRGRFAHSPGANIAAREPAFFRPDELIAMFLELGDVFLSDGILPHAIVHRGCENDRTRRSVDHQTDQIIADAVGGL